MTGQPYTDADVKLVEQAILHAEAPIRPGFINGPDQLTAEARAALDALVATGRLLPEPTAVAVECDIDWTDLRSSRPGADVQARTYEWPAGEFDALLATEIRAADLFHRAPVRIRKRAVKAYADGSKLVGPWVRVELPADV